MTSLQAETTDGHIQLLTEQEEICEEVASFYETLFAKEENFYKNNSSQKFIENYHTNNAKL